MTADPVSMPAEPRRIAAARPDVVLSFADSRGQQPVPSWVRPVNGAGTWRHTPSHGLRLTALGTFVLCLLLAFAFLLVQQLGRTWMCHVNKDPHGHGAMSYCADFDNSQTRTTP